jgi:hypothetical protein
MPLLILVLIAILIAQIGFWDTLGAILGATAALIFFILIAIGIIGLSVRYWLLKIGRRL